MGYAETVCFVAQLLYYAERWRAFVQVQGHRVVGIEKFFEAFGNTDYVDFSGQSEFGQYPVCGTQLAFASVDDYKVGQWRVFVFKRL